MARSLIQRALLYVWYLDCVNSLINTDKSESVQYGVDVSWPMHHDEASSNYPWLPHNVNPTYYPIPDRYRDMVLQPLGNVQERYHRYMEGCFNYWEKQSGKGGLCYDYDADRIDMVSKQPHSVRNYTAIGYKLTRAPQPAFDLLLDFWNRNKQNQKLEQTYEGNPFTNNWESPTYLVDVDDEDNEGAGYLLKEKVWNAVQVVVEEWTGQLQTGTSIYGVRTYTSGAILSPHVDRIPLVSSCIINIDQDVDEAWPLEVIGHDGVARNITMKPGDMVLYESHSVIHGRPFSLEGRFMANVFLFTLSQSVRSSQ